MFTTHAAFTTYLVARGITNEALLCLISGPRHVRWRDAVTLLVRDDFHTAILENANT
jgi:hypothetical protein